MYRKLIGKCSQDLHGGSERGKTGQRGWAVMHLYIIDNLTDCSGAGVALQSCLLLAREGQTFIFLHGGSLWAAQRRGGHLERSGSFSAKGKSSRGLS